jgi:hypothetical protein
MAPSPDLDRILTKADAIRDVGSKLNIPVATGGFLVSEASFMIDDLTLRRFDHIAYNGVIFSRRYGFESVLWDIEPYQMSIARSFGY